jgi:restriction system protein
MQHQSQMAAKERQRQATAAAKAQAAAARQAEQARKQAERAQAQAARASAAEQKKAEQEAKRLHAEARQAEVASLNSTLVAQYDEIDSLLSATLDVDDFVDLNSLRTVAQHPPFNRPDLEQPKPPPPPLVAPPEPQFVPPPAPTGLGGVLGGKKKHAEEVAQAEAAFAVQHQAWQAVANDLPAQQLRQMQEHQAAEQQRLGWLAQVREQYEAECQQREAEAAEANRELDQLIADLELGVEDAVQEYVAIVLGNSVYPDCFPVAHSFQFDSGLRELELTVTAPAPGDLPSVKEYKYAKAKDEITSTQLPQKDRKDRYAGAVHQLALRTLHEIFEADRAGRIQTISLSVGADSIDPGTGQPKRSALVAVAVDRETFLAIDLANVVPLATLQHLSALVSKNPFDLVAIDESKGVRGV